MRKQNQRIDLIVHLSKRTLSSFLQGRRLCEETAHLLHPTDIRFAESPHSNALFFFQFLLPFPLLLFFPPLRIAFAVRLFVVLSQRAFAGDVVAERAEGGGFFFKGGEVGEVGLERGEGDVRCEVGLELGGERRREVGCLEEIERYAQAQEGEYFGRGTGV